MLLASVLLPVGTACVNELSEVTESVNSETREVRITTRSASSVDYPLTLYAFDETAGTLSQQATAAKRLASSYTEQALGDWRISTREEAKAMRRNLGDEQLATTNALLQANNLITLSGNEVTDAQGNATRYLCNDAAYSFTWNGSNISQTGSKRGYHLRLVKKIMASP